MLSATDYNNNNMYDLDLNCTQWIRIMRVRVCALSFEINIYCVYIYKKHIV